MISVLTLVHGRRRHLDNLLIGLENNAVKPDEVVIIHMNEATAPRESPHFPIVARAISDGVSLPLAAARNAAASAAAGDHLIFLDVDCVPAPTLVGDYLASLRRHPDALHQGEVRYLPAHVDCATATAGELDETAPRHPLHEHRGAGEPVPHDLFWSLNFACRRAVFDDIGGFDTRYRGYGAEDTDFSYRARRAGVLLLNSPALAFHQYHPTYDPPLNHLNSIVANARTFRALWGKWPMHGWLEAFAQRGFIVVHDDDIELKRAPTAQEVDACVDAQGKGF